jgi:P2-related tail formation protein
MSQSNQNILPDSIAGVPHLAAFDVVAFDRFNSVEIQNLLVYIVDSVSESALPYLANQFDIEGFAGYKLATTDLQRRAIIKQAIELKKYAGTVWAVKQAMLLVGYTDASLIEGIDTGDPATDWARFSVSSELGDTIGVDGVTQSYLAKLILQYKPARSFLEGIAYTIGIYDILPNLKDTLNLTYKAPTLYDDLGYFARFADGTHFADGSINAIESLDQLTINIVNL